MDPHCYYLSIYIFFICVHTFKKNHLHEKFLVYAANRLFHIYISYSQNCHKTRSTEIEIGDRFDLWTSGHADFAVKCNCLGCTAKGNYSENTASITPLQSNFLTECPRAVYLACPLHQALREQTVGLHSS